jgi:hypothetical protein
VASFSKAGLNSEVGLQMPSRSGHRRGSGDAPALQAAWLVVMLLFLFMLINIADKAVIGLAGVPIIQELHLTPRQFGLVGSSFFLLFSHSAVATGFIVNHRRQASSDNGGSAT